MNNDVRVIFSSEKNFTVCYEINTYSLSTDQYVFLCTTSKSFFFLIVWQTKSQFISNLSLSSPKIEMMTVFCHINSAVLKKSIAPNKYNMDLFSVSLTNDEYQINNLKWFKHSRKIKYQGKSWIKTRKRNNWEWSECGKWWNGVIRGIKKKKA